MIQERHRPNRTLPAEPVSTLKTLSCTFTALRPLGISSSDGKCIGYRHAANPFKQTNTSIKNHKKSSTTIISIFASMYRQINIQFTLKCVICSVKTLQFNIQMQFQQVNFIILP